MPPLSEWSLHRAGSLPGAKLIIGKHSLSQTRIGVAALVSLQITELLGLVFPYLCMLYVCVTFAVVTFSPHLCAYCILQRPPPSNLQVSLDISQHSFQPVLT